MKLKKVNKELTVIYDSMNVRVVSGLTGSGKTEYVLRKAIESASKGNTILLVNPEDSLEKNDGLLAAANKVKESSKFYHVKGMNLTIEKAMSIAVKLGASYIVIDPLNLMRDTDCEMYEGTSKAIKELEALAAKYNVYVITTLQEKRTFA